MNLNLNEQLLLDTRDANICIFIANLASWLRTNIDREKFEQRNVREGRCWSYNSIKDLQNYFNFWSTKNIRTIIRHCEQQGLILIGNFNKHMYDKTSWYSLTDKALEYYPVLRDKFGTRLHETRMDTHLPLPAKGFAASGKPIPEEHTHIKDLIISDLEKSLEVGFLAKDLNPRSKGNLVIDEIVKTYHELLPDLPKIKKVDYKMRCQLHRMIKDWPSYQKDGKQFSIESFKDYLNYIKQHYSWFVKPYTTPNGNVRRNSLRVLTREINITKIVNGEFNVG